MIASMNDLKIKTGIILLQFWQEWYCYRRHSRQNRCIIIPAFIHKLIIEAIIRTITGRPAFQRYNEQPIFMSSEGKWRMIRKSELDHK